MDAVVKEIVSEIENIVLTDVQKSTNFDTPRVAFVRLCKESYDAVGEAYGRWCKDGRRGLQCDSYIDMRVDNLLLRFGAGPDIDDALAELGVRIST